MLNSRKKIFLIVFLLFLVIHGIIFRDLISDLPNLLSGKDVVAREELIPIFNMQTQFWSQILGGTSELTSSSEVRVGYSAISSWVRYYPVLPLALILLNSFSGFLLFLAFFYFVDNFLKNSRSREDDGQRLPLLAMAAFFSSLFIHLVLLYTKIIHFYTLIFGFSLFGLALSLFLVEYFYGSKLDWKKGLLIAFLVLFNPAIHYHALFYIFIGLLLILSLLTRLFGKGRSWFLTRKNLALFLFVFLVSAVPYIAFVALTAGTGGEDSNIASNYFIIRNFSVDILHVFSLDTASQVDMYAYGLYLPTEIRWLKITVSFMAIFSMYLIGRSSLENRKAYLMIFAIMLVSFWLSFGYKYSFSLHNILGTGKQYLDYWESWITKSFSKAIYLVIQVLRLPHRFQFLNFYLIGILATLFPFLLFDWSKEVFTGKGKRVVVGAFGLIIVASILLTQDYRQVLLTGDFNGFLKPWPVRNELEDIRKYLHENPAGKLFILPSLESGREVYYPDQGYNNFIDKYYIYLLDYPTLYYGSSSDIKNKNLAYLVYRGLFYDEDWWNVILRDYSDVDYILINKEISTERRTGIVYLPDIDSKLENQLRNDNFIEKVFSGNDFDLYRVKRDKVGSSKTVVDVDWNNFMGINRSKDLLSDQGRKILPMDMFYGGIGENDSAMTDSPARLYQDIFASLQKDNFFRPEEYDMPFEKEIIPSSYYSNSTFSLFTLHSNDNRNNYYDYKIPGVYPSLSGNFVGLEPGEALIKIPFQAKEDGYQRLALKQFESGVNLSFRIRQGGRVMVEKTLETPAQKDELIQQLDYLEIYRGYLEKGDYVLELKNSSSKVLIVEGLLVASPKELPYFFGRQKDWERAALVTKDKTLYLKKDEKLSQNSNNLIIYNLIGK